MEQDSEAVAYQPCKWYSPEKQDDQKPPYSFEFHLIAVEIMLFSYLRAFRAQL
jgi:hypothetical protein